MTDNPKVLKFVLHVTLKASTQIYDCIDFWKLYNRSAIWSSKLASDVEKWLWDQLYRLNAEKSRELSEFLIPTDPEQQIAVSKLVWDFLKPTLPERWVDRLEPEIRFSIPIVTSAST